MKNNINNNEKTNSYQTLNKINYKLFNKVNIDEVIKETKK